MLESRFLRLPQIVKNSSGGRAGKRFITQAAAIERMQFEVLENLAAGVITAENPGVERRLQAGCAGRIAFRMQNLSYVQRLDGREQFGRREFGGSKFAGREIGIRETGATVFRKDRCQIVILVRSKEVCVGGGAR